jgi:hypothetical protein
VSTVEESLSEAPLFDDPISKAAAVTVLTTLSPREGAYSAREKVQGTESPASKTSPTSF